MVEGLRSAATPSARPAAAGEEGVLSFTGVGGGVIVGVVVGVFGMPDGDDGELSLSWLLLLLPLLLLLLSRDGDPCPRPGVDIDVGVKACVHTFIRDGERGNRGAGS